MIDLEGSFHIIYYQSEYNESTAAIDSLSVKTIEISGIQLKVKEIQTVNLTLTKSKLIFDSKADLNVSELSISTDSALSVESVNASKIVNSGKILAKNITADKLT